MLRSRKSSTQTSQLKSTVSNEAVDNTFGGVGWVGPITLRKRAKPELENTRYRDISLKISVQEVKNVNPKGRYFCEICLDRTLYARTTSKLSDGTVFWGEKFDLNNLPEISIITINLYRQGSASVKDKRQRCKGQNQFVAFVTVPITDLTPSSEYQQWLPMRSPHTTAYRINVDNLQDSSISSPTESRRSSSNTTSPNGARFRKRSMPVTCFRPINSSATIQEADIDKAKSAGKKKRSWTSSVVNTSEGTNGKTSDQSSAKPSSVSANNSPTYLLSNNVFNLSETPVPQLRISIVYEAVDVLPLDYYGDFHQLLKTHTIKILKFLEPKLSAKQKEELASCVVNIHEKVSDLTVADLLAEMVKLEIAEDASQTMLLRSNSIASKAIECYIKLVGTEYLHRILKEPIDQLLVSTVDFEIDPHRIKVPETPNTTVQAVIEKNKMALLNQIYAIWNRIVDNTKRLPYELREIFSTLRCLFEQTLGSQIAIQLISGCLFLRFICPAIHGPVLFGLTSSVPESDKVSRNLTLLAKVLQNLANMVFFEEKEVHMKIFNPFMEKEIPVMKAFLESISSLELDDGEESSYSDCHHYIDLGFEYAKLASVLMRYIKEMEVPSELSRLPTILQYIHEHTTDAVLSTWAPDIVACRRFASCNDTHLQMESLSGVRPRFTSIDSIRANPLPNKHTLPVESSMTQNHKTGSRFSTEESVLPSNEVVHLLGSSMSNGRSSDKDCQPSDVTHSEDKLNSSQANGLDSISTRDASKTNIETMENLFFQYQEQLRQLNACIEQVENIALATEPLDVQRIRKEDFSPSRSFRPETSGRNSQHTSQHGGPRSQIYRKNDSSVPTEGSDYEIGDDEPETDRDQCRSEPVKFVGRKYRSESQNRLAESPSLDQLAERLHELKHLLKQERHELVQVVAEKTMAIKEQENSLEKMVSELDRLRHHPATTPTQCQPAPSSSKLLTPGTISPSSSFSSGCFASTMSEDFCNLSADKRSIESVSHWHQKSESSVRQQTTQYAVNKLRSQSFHSHSTANRVKVNGSGSEVLASSQFVPNLLDLSRASEGTGIPLGDLIVSKHSIPIRRRTSETRTVYN